MQKTTAVLARKPHRCADCHGKINPGDVYLRHVASPDDPDLGNSGWWHISECEECATRYGRKGPIEARRAAPVATETGKEADR